MGQSNQRSVSLTPSVFTSPIAVNKGNKIRVLSRDALLHITVDECISFCFLEPAGILVPVWLSPKHEQIKKGSPDIEDCLPAIEAVSVERVISTKQKTAKNRLKVILQESPSQILHCQAKNLTLTKKTLPAPSGPDRLAIAVYTYQVEIRYKDLKGQLKQEFFASGTRCQQVAFEPPARSFNVIIHSRCVYE